MASRILTILATLCFILNIYQFSVHAYPKPYTQKLQSRTTEPYFPDSPASCPICAANYDSISSCAEAAPVLANFSMVCQIFTKFTARILELGLWADHLQPRSVHRRDQVRVYRHVPVCVSPVCRLVSALHTAYILVSLTYGALQFREDQPNGRS